VRHAALGAAPLSSLNPALEDVRFCPRCGKEAEVAFPRSIRCPHCGYGAYYNPKPVACAIPRDANGDIVLIRRGFQPRRGHWSMPGGFVDLGESVEDAARRECMEEIGIEVEIGALLGVYSDATDRVVVVAYEARTEQSPQTTEEALEVRAFCAEDLPWQRLAFRSDELALRDLLARSCAR
jgi:ADP-ribose pyrophosphatase YjhB (NUDIX family)